MRLYVTVGGMSCGHCRTTVAGALAALGFVNAVRLYVPRGRGAASPDCFEVDVDDACRQHLGQLRGDIAQAVEDVGYSCSPSAVRATPPAPAALAAAGKLAAVAAVILILYAAVRGIVGYDFLSVIPAIDDSLSLGALFAAGLMTSVHCMGMCGSITLAASLGAEDARSVLQPVLYNLGRLVSYTAFGAIAGAVGSVLSLSGAASGALMAAAGVLMAAMALSIGGVWRFRLPLPSAVKRLPTAGGPFALGLANVLMPCGPLQAMQLYALASGSPLLGAASMAAFCLGTVPLLLGFGLVSNAVTGKVRSAMQTAGAGLMLVLACGMVFRGALACGLDLPSARAAESYNGYVVAQLSADGSVQEAKFDLSYSGYRDLALQVGVPAKVTIHADAGTITGCNNAVRFPEWGVEQDLHAGDNVIEFTPDKTGEYNYTCWMSMLHNRIAVVDSLAAIAR